MRRGWLSKKSADTPSRTDSSVREGLASASVLQAHRASTLVQCQKISPISLVKSLSGGLGLKTRRPPGRFCRALRFRFSFFLPLGYRSCLYKRVSYPTRTPTPAILRLSGRKKNPRNKPGTTLTPSGGTSETRYTQGPGTVRPQIAFAGHALKLDSSRLALRTRGGVEVKEK